MWRQQDFFPILASVALPAGTVVAVESSSFVSGLDGLPEFSTSTGATIHMESATPTDIATARVVATPVKNLFQTDLIGLKTFFRPAGESEREARGSRIGSVVVMIRNLDDEYRAEPRANAAEVREDLEQRERLFEEDPEAMHEAVMAATRPSQLPHVGQFIDSVQRQAAGHWKHRLQRTISTPTTIRCSPRIRSRSSPR